MTRGLDKRGTASLASAANLSNLRSVHKDLLEKALEMRCVSYLADAKAQLLIRTVTTVGESKRLADGRAESLSSALKMVRQEVEARHRVERQLRDVTEAVERAPVMVLIHREGKIVYANSTFRDAFGEQVLVGSILDVLLRIAVEPVEVEAFTSGALPWSGELRVHCEAGDARWVRVAVADGQSHGEGDAHTIAVVEDVTQERDAKRRIARAEQLAVLGQLVGGVAHDFNNILMGVAASVELMRDAPASEVSALVDEVNGAVSRGGKLTRQLLAFAGQQVLVAESLDPLEVVGATMSMLERTLGEDHSLLLDSDGVVERVRCDRGQFEAAVVNLVLNARDASPAGAPIAIELDGYENVCLRECGPGELAPGRYVRCSVRDYGTGVPIELQKTMWDPFVSSKEGGIHSGVGLSMVGGFAQQSGGGVELSTPPGEAGCRVSLYLPVETTT